MSNQTEQTPAPIDTATARTYTTVSHVTFIDLPDGTIAKLSTMTPDDGADVSICPTMDANGVAGWRIAWAMGDEGYDFDPIDNSDQGERYDWPRWPDYIGVNFDDCRTAIDRVGIGQGRRVFFVDHDGHPRRDWTAMGSPRWTYIVPEDVPADQWTAYAEAVWAEWRAWAAGEVYVVCSVDVDANSNELPDTAVSIGGIIGDDWAAECVQRAARYSAEGI